MDGAIDLFVNPNMSIWADNQSVRDAGQYYLKSTRLMEDQDMPSILNKMDQASVAHALITIDAEDPKPWLLDFTRQRPDRFSLCPFVRVENGISAVWALRDLAQSEKVAMARVMPSLVGQPPTHRTFYPLFAKCAELELPVSVFTGIPGPAFDAASQDPLHLDIVCRDFPMLTIIMTHGADPWWNTAIRLMLKYPNLYLTTSAWLGRYLPSSLIDYMNTRGQAKIMWASDDPVIDMKRSIDDAKAIELRPGVRERFLYENAKAVLRL